MKIIDQIDRKYFKFAVDKVGKDTDTDIQARCIICGDSERDERQMRLHLYVKPQYDTSICHCFNCGWKGNMFQFLKETNTTLYEEYIKEKRESSFNNMKKKKEKNEYNIDIRVESYTRSNSRDNKVQPLCKTDKLPEEVFFLPEEFQEASSCPEASEYLKKRKIESEGFFFSKRWIKLNGKDIPVKNCIIIPLWVNERERVVFGFQARSIESKFFYTYIPGENSGFKVWNWFGIDRTKPTFIFESVFDALSSGLPRDCICAALGSDLIEERASELSKPIYCFDNQRSDYTSKIKSLELLKKGKKVFVWPTDIKEKDANEFIQNNHTNQEMAKIILSNIEEGMNGIMRLKLMK